MSLAHSRKTVLVLTTHYPPNVGGVESHLQALIASLIKRNWNVVVSTYQPLASGKRAPFTEKRTHLTIYRFPWLGFNIFHRLTPYPALEFLFLFPGLFMMTCITLLKHKEIAVVHCQGLVPTAVGICLKPFFRKRVIASTHNLYFFPKEGLYPSFARLFFSLTDKVLAPTKFAREELLRIGVPGEKVGVFHYWIDLKLFTPENKKTVKRKLKWDKFTVFFVGRLIETKGVGILLKVAVRLNRKIQMVIVGGGPMTEEVAAEAKKIPNLIFLGRAPNEQLLLCYRGADLTLVPSIVDEGFGFVVMESAACGTPILASKKGGLSEAVADSIGRLVAPTASDFKRQIEYYYSNKKELNNLTRATRAYALKNFGEKNVDDIIRAYRE